MNRTRTIAALFFAGTLTLGLGACSTNEPTPAPPVSTPTPTETVGVSFVDNVVVTEHGIRVGNPDAETEIKIMIDQQCPHCKSFSEEVDKELTAAINTGDLAVEYLVTDFLNDRSFGGWSLTAANTLNIVAHSNSADLWKDAYMALYTLQPMSDEEVATTEEVIATLEEIGITLTDEEQAQIDTAFYADKIDSDTQYAFSLGIESSPAVVVGDEVEPLLSSPELFKEFLKTGEVPTDQEFTEESPA